MKLAAVTLYLFAYGTLYTLVVDWMAGNRWNESFSLLQNPFKLMTLPEYALAAILLLALAASIAGSSLKKRFFPTGFF